MKFDEENGDMQWCHPERSEGSLVGARDSARHPDPFAALRMTWPRW